MIDELKPCPFCGHEPKYLGANAQFAVACVNDACLCLANSDYVGAWNTRPVEDALRARIYELETQWASVPWEALWRIYNGQADDDAWIDYGDWLLIYAPGDESL